MPFKVLITCPPMLRAIDRFRAEFERRGIEITTPNVTQILSEPELIELVPQFDGWIIGDDPAYRLAPDFSNAFAGRGLSKATGSTTLPTPSVVDVWKPLTPTGARTSYFNKLPPPGGELTAEEPTPSAHKEEFFKKLDRIYARLDDLESRHSENSQTEVLLFIMSGIFVLFSMDLLVRKTGNVRIMTR